MKNMDEGARLAAAGFPFGGFDGFDAETSSFTLPMAPVSLDWPGNDPGQAHRFSIVLCDGTLRSDRSIADDGSRLGQRCTAGPRY